MSENRIMVHFFQCTEINYLRNVNLTPSPYAKSEIGNCQKRALAK